MSHRVERPEFLSPMSASGMPPQAAPRAVTPLSVHVAPVRRLLRTLARYDPACQTARGGRLDGLSGLGLTLTVRDRDVLAWATRHGALLPSQIRRRFFPETTSPRPVWNRLARLCRAGYVLRVPLGRHLESVYLPTALGTLASGTGLSQPERAKELERGLTQSGGHAPQRGRLGGQGHRRLLGKLGHDLTVVEVEEWLLRRARAAGRTGAMWLTERELRREAGDAAARTAPGGKRRGGAGLPPVPDGCLVVEGERLAVEVELTRKADQGDYATKFAWYRDRARYRAVLWLTPTEGSRRWLEGVIQAHRLEHLMRVEALPPEVPVH